MFFLTFLFSACIDTKIDTPDSSLYDTDLDDDGFGEDDCDDSNALVSPAAEELCDGIDNNCNGQIDEDVQSTFYADADGDGFGDENVSTEACEEPEGYSSDFRDCDDTDSSISPAAEERCNDIDDDCDGMADNGLLMEQYYADSDGDGRSDGEEILIDGTDPLN